MLTPRKKKIIVKEHAMHDTDTGSSPVQVGLLSRRIDELVDHLKKNPKDNASRRGLLKLVSKRRKLLAYLEKNEPKTHSATVKKLGLK